MDGTLILNTNSVKYLCQLNHKLQEVEEVEKEEEEGKYSWIEADYKKVKLIKGLNVEKVAEGFSSNIKLIDGIAELINTLKKLGVITLLITAGPIEVAEVIAKGYQFDHYYGSEYEVKNRSYTGKIKYHLGADGKKKCFQDFCDNSNISPLDTIAIGDSSSDIEIFKICGKSIAINYSSSLVGYATEYIKTKDIRDVAEFLEIENLVIAT